MRMARRSGAGWESRPKSNSPWADVDLQKRSGTEAVTGGTQRDSRKTLKERIQFVLRTARHCAVTRRRRLPGATRRPRRSCPLDLSS